MEKRLVIKNTETNRYFTADYNNFWSLDINEACTYIDCDTIMRDISKLKEEDDDNPFEKIKNIIIETIIDLR
ncbi:MAG: hypothetical protein IPJ01_10485 [Micavibrio sp.]|nr:hypothetical protein [Micavibrio sp.]